MDTSVFRALTALLDPLALLTIMGSLAFLWVLWRVLADDVDLHDRHDRDRGDDGGDGGRPAPGTGAGTTGSKRPGTPPSGRRAA